MDKYWRTWFCRRVMIGINRGMSRVVGVRRLKEIITKLYRGRDLDLEHPRKLNEKILWLEYFTDSSLRSRLTDKYEVRRFVAERGYEENLIPLLGVYRHAEEADLETLPQRFVMKATHGCDMNYICRDKSRLDERELRRRMRFWLKTNLSYLSMEMHYRTIRPGIICEEYLDGGEEGLADYKLHCSDGKVRFILVCIEKAPVRYRNVFNTEWQELDVVTGARKNPEPTPRPEKLAEMIQMAEKLAEGIPFVRVDLYLVREKIYFGEMTFTPATGVLFHFTEEFLLEEGKYCTIQ